MAALILAASEGLGLLIGGVYLVKSVASILPYSAPMYGLSVSSAASILGAAAGFTIAAAISAGAVEKIVHDSRYPKQLWEQYTRASAQSVRLTKMMEDKNKTAVLVTNLLLLMGEGPKPGIQEQTGFVDLLRPVYRPLGM